MKRTFLLLSVLLTVMFVKSQGRADYSEFNIPTKENKPFYEKVDSVNKSKTEIYSAVRKSFSDLFKSGNDVIQLADKDAGQIVGKGMLELHHKIQLGVNTTTPVKFTINVQVKDNKYRIQLYDFIVISPMTHADEEIEKVRKYAKGWRDRFFPAFNENMEEIISKFVKKTNDNIKQLEF